MNLQSEYHGKNSYPEKKTSLMAYNAGTNLIPLYVGAKYFISRGLGKKLLPKPRLHSF